ncbi:MAG TPA: hypothetical protein VF178_05970 [Gemmatimonadaceae bacterium]
MAIRGRVAYRPEKTPPSANLHRGELWNLEYSHSILRCDSLWYKVLSVDLSDRGRWTISEQRTGYMEQPWRRIEANSGEQLVAQRACDIARSHATRRRAGR